MTAQSPIVGPPGAAIRTDGRNLIVRYRGIDVVRVAYQHIILDTPGERTHTALVRLNQVARQFGLDYRVAARAGVWMVETDLGTYRYADGRGIHRSPANNHEYVRYHQPLRR